MNICSCALPAITGNSDCCKNCYNNQRESKVNFIWTTDDKVKIPDGIAPSIKQPDNFDWSNSFNNYKSKLTLDAIKENIENLTIKEIKELMEYMKKYEVLK